MREDGTKAMLLIYIDKMLVLKQVDKMTGGIIVIYLERYNGSTVSF